MSAKNIATVPTPTTFTLVAPSAVTGTFVSAGYLINDVETNIISQAYPVFSIRLAPSVDGGTTGLLGARELINRMQLTPAGVGVYTTTAGVRVEIRFE